MSLDFLSIQSKADSNLFGFLGKYCYTRLVNIASDVPANSLLPFNWFGKNRLSPFCKKYLSPNGDFIGNRMTFILDDELHGQVRGTLTEQQWTIWNHLDGQPWTICRSWYRGIGTSSRPCCFSRLMNPIPISAKMTAATLHQKIRVGLPPLLATTRATANKILIKMAETMRLIRFAFTRGRGCFSPCFLFSSAWGFIVVWLSSSTRPVLTAIGEAMFWRLVSGSFLAFFAFASLRLVCSDFFTDLGHYLAVSRVSKHVHRP